jgi:hypothetical protein
LDFERLPIKHFAPDGAPLDHKKAQSFKDDAFTPAGRGCYPVTCPQTHGKIEKVFSGCDQPGSFSRLRLDAEFRFYNPSMPLQTTSPVRIEAVGNNARYFLPARPLGNVRWLGLIPIVFGTIFIGMPLRAFLSAVTELISGKGGIFEIFIALFLSVFVIAGFIPIMFGLFAICGKSRIDWRERRLFVSDYVGPIRWRRRLPAQSIQKLTIAHARSEMNGKPVAGPLASLAGLRVDFESAKPRFLVIGYPREWLENVANDLSNRIGVSVSMSAPKVEVEELLPLEAAALETVEKPAASKVRLEKSGGNLTMIIPPSGIGKGSKGMFTFGIFWNLFIAIFTAVFLFADGKNSNNKPPFFLWGILGFFWLIGAGMLLGAINMGRRRAVISAANGELRIAQESIFGKKLYRWRSNEISAICADRSGMEMNGVPVIELQIFGSGKKSGFFAGRDDAELLWIASELRNALKVSAGETSEFRDKIRNALRKR